MTKPQTVKDWVNYIYDKLTIAERTNSWVAEGLQKIEVEHERMTAYAKALERNGVANGTITKLREKHKITPEMLGE